MTLLICNSSRLTELDVSQNPNLEALLCAYNRLTELNIENNPKLQTLDCSHNQLASLDVSRNSALESLLCMGNDLAELQIEACPKLTEMAVDVGTTVRGAQEDAEIIRHGGAALLEAAGSEYAILEDGTYFYENDYAEKHMTLPWGVNSTLVQFDGDISIDFLPDAVGPNSQLIDGGDALIIEGPFYIRLRDGDGSILSSTLDRTKIRMNSAKYMVEGNVVSREAFFEGWGEYDTIALVVRDGYVTEINCLAAPKVEIPFYDGGLPIRDGGQIFY